LDHPDYEPVNSIDSDIHLENITFSYPGSGQVVLKNISFTIEHGKTTAIVGPSGSGKSTLVKLLERFYDPAAGTVIVNNKDLRTLNLRQYRHNVGYVGQEPCLLNESIKDNLLNANPKATEEDIYQALETVGAIGFVSKLRDGIDSNVGSVGSKISGGQKQRLAIARAIIKKPDLLIFDEATSALDTENEEKVQKAINEVLRLDMTKVVIAHRLSTIEQADKIIVVQNGEIIEEGTHSQLMESNNLYHTLVNIQETAKKAMATHKVFKNISSKEANSGDSSKRLDILEDNDTDDELSSMIKSESVKTSSTLINETEETRDLGAPNIFLRLLPYNKPYFFIPLVMSGILIVSSGYVLAVIIEMEIMVSFLGIDYDYMRRQMRIFLPQFLAMAVLILIIQWVARYCLFNLTASMIKALRMKVYENLIRQPAKFFDKEGNSSGNLVGTLADEIRSLNGASIEQYALLAQGVLGMVAAIIVSLCYFWHIGLITAGVVPITAG
jgi:ATP-binding cassette, subfamily B (MDR/TAP), member 1